MAESHDESQLEPFVYDEKEVHLLHYTKFIQVHPSVYSFYNKPSWRIVYL